MTAADALERARDLHADVTQRGALHLKLRTSLALDAAEENSVTGEAAHSTPAPTPNPNPNPNSHELKIFRLELNPSFSSLLSTNPTDRIRSRRACK